MKLRDVIAAGVKPLVQNRLRAGLSILGIFIGIAGVLCMIAIGKGPVSLANALTDARCGRNEAQRS
ncbi:hypothetical protein J4G08_01465 [Candidatus Poribacteria bacterium]|nr:hypothetical protein [Candidatus Poribacteria bacterium]